MTIADIIEASAANVLRAADRPTYAIGKVEPVEDMNAYCVTVSDTVSGRRVPMTWTKLNDLRNTDEGRVALATAMLKNAIASLDFLIEHNG